MSNVFEFLDSIPQDQLKLIIYFILMLPLGWMFTYIKNPNLRMSFGLILGILFQYYVYGISMLHVVFATCANLFLIKFIHPSKVGKYALVYNFGHNSLIHLYRLIFEYDNWSVEVSTIFMITMCKFSAFAYGYQDAYMYQENKENIREKHKRYMIQNYTLFEYFSYTYFFSTSGCGPFMEFNDFMNFIHLRKEYEKLPSSIWPSIKKFLIGFIFYGLFTISKPYGVNSLIDPTKHHNFLEKSLLFVLGSFQGYKYIGAFCFVEASVIACGLSFNGLIEENNSAPASDNKKNDHDEWGKIKSTEVVNLLLTHKPSDFFRFWNISVHVFLKRYVYFRVLQPNPNFAQKEFASSIVFFTSAFWHGFHPTYFFAFAHFYFFILLEKQILKYSNGLNENNLLHKIFIANPKFSVYFFRSIVFFFLVPYNINLFVCLDHVRLCQFLESVWAIGTISVIILNILFYFLNRKFKTHKKEN